MEKPRQFNLSIIFRIILVVFILLLSGFVSIRSFLGKAESKIKSQDGKVNLLILGKGGVGHAGGDLTDTMIFASVSLKDDSVSLVSLPRDIWIPEIRAKINSAYYWGKVKPEFGGGLSFAKEVTQKIVGVPVNYALVLDFSSFKDIVDAVGGVNIDVANSFTDNLYPIAGKEDDLCDGDRELKCRYEMIHFEKGINFMNGTTALKYVRSRNGDNDENTDIAREVRQQKVISAIKNKSLSYQTFLNPFKLIRLWKVANSSIETDLDFSSMLVLGKRFLMAGGSTHSLIIPDGILISPPKSERYDNQYVFVPKTGDWSELQNWLKENFKN